MYRWITGDFVTIFKIFKGQRGAGWKVLVVSMLVLFSFPSWASSRSSVPYSVPAGPMSSTAQELIRKAFEGLGTVVDAHAHIVGMGQGGTGCEVNPRMLSPRHPFKRIMAKLYLSASGAQDFDHFDQEYVERLLSLARDF